MGTCKANKKGIPAKEWHFKKVGRGKNNRVDMIQMEKSIPNLPDAKSYVKLISSYENNLFA